MADNKANPEKKKKKDIRRDLTPREEKLLEFIGRFESKGGDYDIVYGGYKGEVPKPITEMTLNEVIELQEKMKASGSSAVGGLQMLQEVVKEEMKKQGISGDELFDKNLQQNMMINRLKRFRGYDSFVNSEGNKEDIIKFATNLSKEFASIPVPVAMKGHKREVKAGESYYAGDGLNKSLTNVEELLNELAEIKDYEVGDTSITEEAIANNPNLSDDQKEEFMRVNESQGLDQQTADSLLANYDEASAPSGPTTMDLLNGYMDQPQGYSGQGNIASYLSGEQQDPNKKKDQSQTEKALGYTGDISAFSKDFNLLDHQFEDGGKLTGCGGPGEPPCKELSIEEIRKRNAAYNERIKNILANEKIKQDSIMNSEGIRRDSIMNSEKIKRDSILETEQNRIKDNWKNNNFNDGGLLNSYNEGGSHQENPHGGIPVGQNQKGGFNLVEEGETRFNDYIFSNAHKLNKEEAKRFNLNPKYIGKPYSDISKDINQHMEDRSFDRIAKRTAEGNLNKLMMAQEAIKEKELVKEKARDLTPEEIAEAKKLGMDPHDYVIQKGVREHEGRNQQFMFGGIMSGVMNGAAQAGVAGAGQSGAAGAMGQAAAQGGGAQGTGELDVEGIAGDAGTLLGFAQNAFGDHGVTTDGTAGRQEQEKGKGWKAAGAGIQGAAMGAKYGGPIGAAAGAVIGVGSSLLGSNKKKKAIHEGNMNASLIENNQFNNTFHTGGALGHIHTDPTDPKKKKGGKGTTDARDASANGRGAIGALSNLGRSMWSGLLDGATTPWDNREFEGIPTNKRPDVNSVLTYKTPSYNPEQNELHGDLLDNYLNKANISLRNQRIAQGVEPSIGEEGIQSRMDQITLSDDVMMHAYNKYIPGKDYDPDDIEANLPEKIYKKSKDYKTKDQFMEDNMYKPQGMQAEELLRYAPVAGNLMAYLNAPEARKESYDRLDNRYKPDYVDERSLENRVAQSAANTRNAITNASGGDQGALRANLLASHANESKALSDAMIQAENINRGENTKKQQFDFGVDRINQRIDMQETIANGQNEDAAFAYKQNALQSGLEDLGNIGGEARQARMLENMSGGYTTDGRKLQGRQGLASLFDDEDDALVKAYRNGLAGLFRKNKQ